MKRCLRISSLAASQSLGARRLRVLVRNVLREKRGVWRNLIPSLEIWNNLKRCYLQGKQEKRKALRSLRGGGKTKS